MVQQLCRIVHLRKFRAHRAASSYNSVPECSTSPHTIMGLTEQENRAPVVTKPSGFDESILRELADSLQLAIDSYKGDEACSVLEDLIKHTQLVGDAEDASSMLIALLEQLKLPSTNTVDNGLLVSQLNAALVNIGEADTKIYEISAQSLVTMNTEIKQALGKLQGSMQKGKQVADQHAAARDELEVPLLQRTFASPARSYFACMRR